MLIVLIVQENAALNQFITTMNKCTLKDTILLLPPTNLCKEPQGTVMPSCLNDDLVDCG